MMRAQRYEKMTLKKGAWSPEEDQKLIAYIKRYGIWNWSEMPKAAGLLRSGKSCRLRWVNYLRPDIKRGNFTREEEETILRIHGMLGNKWSAIASALPGRTDNEIKNYWHTHLKKRVPSQVPTGTEASKKNFPKIDPESSLSDGSGNIPALAQNPGPAVAINNENPNIESNLGSETFREVLSFGCQPLKENENFNLEDMFVDPGFIVPHCEVWCPEQISPYDFYVTDASSSDLWFNLSASAYDDHMGGFKKPNVHF